MSNRIHSKHQLGYRGQQVLDLILTQVDRRGEVPSYQVIADRLGMTKAHVCHVIRRLENRGLLKRRTVGERKRRGWHGPVVELE